MAFDFPAYHEERARYHCSAGELMDAIEQVLDELKWSGAQSGRWLFRASTGVSLWSWGENVVIEVNHGGRLFIRSECSFPTQCIDWGRNRSNVRRFLEQLDDILGEHEDETEEDD